MLGVRNRSCCWAIVWHHQGCGETIPPYDTWTQEEDRWTKDKINRHHFFEEFLARETLDRVRVRNKNNRHEIKVVKVVLGGSRTKADTVKAVHLRTLKIRTRAFELFGQLDNWPTFTKFLEELDKKETT